MLTTKPVSVQIMACDTPLAIVRASADPRSAMESNTSSMPDTVPTSPSSGDRGTSTRISGKLDVISELSREIIAWRIWRAHQLRCSDRSAQADSISCVRPGKEREKYHARSITSVHITTPDRKMNRTNGPPPSTRSRTAVTGIAIQLGSSTALHSLRAARFDALRQHAGALLFQGRNDLARQRYQRGVGEQQRNRDAQAEHGG